MFSNQIKDLKMATFLILDFLRYYEGQITPISEVDVENALENQPVPITEAAEKVRKPMSSFNY